jgi:hypothetical protein
VRFVGTKEETKVHRSGRGRKAREERVHQFSAKGGMWRMKEGAREGGTEYGGRGDDGETTELQGFTTEAVAERR